MHNSDSPTGVLCCDRVYSVKSDNIYNMADKDEPGNLFKGSLIYIQTELRKTN